MKKFLLVSVFFNVIFLIVAVYVLIRRSENSFLNTESGTGNASETEKPYWYYKNYDHWKETTSLYAVLPNDSNEIIFLGNSITQGCEWAELFSNPKIKNRGIGGDNTEGVLERLTEITESNPDKIFLDLGTNDLALNMRISEICRNYEEIIDRIRMSTPKTEIYIQSVLPTNSHPERNNDSIIALNKNLTALADKKSATFINLFDSFLNKDGNLSMELSFDGLHLNGQGYLIWKKCIEEYVGE